MVSDTIRRATGQGWAAGADATWSASRPSCAALSPVVDPRKATRPATTQPTTIQVVRGRTAARRDAMRSPRCRTAGCPRIAKIDESGRYRHRQRRRWDGGGTAVSYVRRDRKSVGEGKSVSGRVVLGGRRLI